MLFETPYRQLIPFSPFDSGLGDANMLIMAKSGGGKTFLAHLKLLMMARARPLVSILERGDSYEPLIELMGARVITLAGFQRARSQFTKGKAQERADSSPRGDTSCSFPQRGGR